MPLGTEVGLDPGDTVRWGTQLPLKRGIASTFWRMSIVAKRLDLSRCQLVLW